MTLSSSPALVKACCISSKSSLSFDGATVATACRSSGNLCAGCGIRASGSSRWGYVIDYLQGSLKHQVPGKKDLTGHLA